MRMKEAYERWAKDAPLAPSVELAFKAGWEASENQMGKTWEHESFDAGFKAGYDAKGPREPDNPIFAGTMQGVANYLERLDRSAFATLRRAYEADGWTTKTAQRYAIEYLQIEWCNIGDAWRIAQKLVD